MHWWLADQETHLVDPKAVSLCLDLNGNVAETSGSNFLILRDKTIWSPSQNNILSGVSSNFVNELAEELGVGFVEKDVSVNLSYVIVVIVFTPRINVIIARVIFALKQNILPDLVNTCFVVGVIDKI